MKAVDLLEKMLNLNSSEIVSEQYQKVLDNSNELLINLVREKKYDEAIELCDRLNKLIIDKWQLIVPNSPFKEFIFDMIGKVYVSRKEFEKARQTYDNILKLENISSQTKFDTYYKLGIIYKKMNQLDKSIHFLKKAISQKIVPPQKRCIVLSYLADCYIISKEDFNIYEILKIIEVSRDAFENYFYDTCFVLFSLSELAKIFYLIKEKDMYNLCFVLSKTVEKLSKEDKNRLKLYQKLCNNSINLFIKMILELDKIESSTSYKIVSKINRTIIGRVIKKKLK